MQDEPNEKRRVPHGEAAEKATTILNAGRAPSGTDEPDVPQQPGSDVGEEQRGASKVKVEARTRIHQLEKEKLEMMSAHNQQLRTLEAEVTCLRAHVEHGEARRAELEYQVTVSRGDAQRACQDNEALVEQAASLQKLLDVTQQARLEERLALQQEADERDALIEGLTSESERLHQLLQRQEEAQRRMVALQKEAQGRKSMEADMKAERAAHLELKRKWEVTQAALAVERHGQQEAQCNLEQVRRELRDVARAYQEETRNAVDLAEKLEEEKRQHGNTHLLLEQVLKREVHCGKLLEEIRAALQQHAHKGGKDDGKRSPPADVMQLLRLMLRRLKVTEQQVRDLLLACERLDGEKQSLERAMTYQKRRLQEAQQLSLKLRERATRLQEESRDWSAQKEELQKQSQAHSSFLHCIYQRLLAGCVPAEPQSTLGTFSGSDLCDLIEELVERITSDFREANNKAARLQVACEEKSGRLDQLRRRHNLVMARTRESGKRQAEARSGRHARTVTQLRDLLSLSCRKSDSFLSACALLAGTMAHSRRRLSSLVEQNHLLARRLAAREELEEELRRLAGALAGDGVERAPAGSRARARWKKYVCAVSALRWWRAVGGRSTELFRLETRSAAGPVVCVVTATLMGEDVDEDRDALCARWLHSKRLSAAILACMADLHRPTTHMRLAARSGLARLLDQIGSQSESAPEILCEMIPRHLPPSDVKTLVSPLQRHFLLLSQRLHSAEVERRSLRLQVAHLRGMENGGEDTCRTVPAVHFHSVCTNLRQALSGEQEVRALLQEQLTLRDALQRRVDAHAAEREQACRALRRMAEALAEARRRLRGKERSLTILGKHLSRVDKERRRLERRLRHVEDANRRQRHVIAYKEMSDCPAIGAAKSRK
ncbi:uncharacterized protein ccdc171 [Festucalex cinctus]